MNAVLSGRHQGFALLALSAISLGVSVLLRELAGDVTLCGVKALSGLPCPFCGGVRATAALGRGALVEAFGWNPALTLLHAGMVTERSGAGPGSDAAVARSGPPAVRVPRRDRHPAGELGLSGGSGPLNASGGWMPGRGRTHPAASTYTRTFRRVAPREPLDRMVSQRSSTPR